MEDDKICTEKDVDSIVNIFIHSRKNSKLEAVRKDIEEEEEETLNGGIGCNCMSGCCSGCQGEIDK